MAAVATGVLAPLAVACAYASSWSARVREGRGVAADGSLRMVYIRAPSDVYCPGRDPQADLP